ncbi:hypothetical protein [Methylocystis sp.]|uniref:hypothetical protein n=1 Tax=Methylocystis sp. TaxID=1911079 RepID=UPI003DA35820
MAGTSILFRRSGWPNAVFVIADRSLDFQHCDYFCAIDRRIAIPCPLYGSADFCDAMTPEIAEAEDRIRKKLSDV